VRQHGIPVLLSFLRPSQLTKNHLAACLFSHLLALREKGFSGNMAEFVFENEDLTALKGKVIVVTGTQNTARLGSPLPPPGGHAHTWVGYTRLSYVDLS
jgi:hypothetical protein